MKTFLDQVCEQKFTEIALHQEQISEADLRQQVEQLPPVPSFSQALLRPPGAPLSIIAEVKAKAPGRENVKVLDLDQIVTEYQAGGVQALSVLTDESHFGGSLETLATVRQKTTLPLLHKEFIVDPYQLLQGRLRGASAALILVYYFSEIELEQMIEHARQMGVQAVVECSLSEELPRALSANPDILLINNRPIAAIPANPSRTYQQGSVEVSVQWWSDTPELREWKAQDGKCLISASCISEPSHVQKLVDLPYDAILIGNAAMKASNRIEFLQSLQVTP